ncbi:hypothetical protein [Candidatus Thiosymbion oneisti]|uniref:hypothetical protein n=1 Tax=Candidatus Thiosymbion oneisti TaxID=589554 RepID=UPI00105E9E91|nr:hypothetical protein [Candidatus Thiosymbion oneisti]
MGLDELAAKLGLRFPADTELLGVRSEQGMDDALFAKVTFGAQGWAAFVLSASLTEADFTEDKRYLLGPDEDWWDPERPASLPTAQAALPNAEYLNVGVDRGDGARILVYLMWHQT